MFRLFLHCLHIRFSTELRICFWLYNCKYKAKKHRGDIAYIEKKILTL